MASTSFLSSSNRYIFESCGDKYIRENLSKFQGSRYRFNDDKDDFNQASDPTSKPTHITEVRSVVENVIALKHVFEEHAIGQDPFGKAWQNAMVAYAEDMERRIYPLIFGNSWIGVFRESIVAMAKHAAQSGLSKFAISDLSCGLEEQLIFGHSWVFFLLETHVGAALRRSHKSLPDDDGDFDPKVVPEKLKESQLSFTLEKSLAKKSIERIRSSRQLVPGIHFFDMAGEELKNTGQGLLYKEAESAKEISRVPGDHGSGDELYACLSQAIDSTSSHCVVIALSQEMWETASTGLGAGYVSWMVKDAASGHYLLCFPTLGKALTLDD